MTVTSSYANPYFQSTEQCLAHSKSLLTATELSSLGRKQDNYDIPLDGQPRVLSSWNKT